MKFLWGLNFSTCQSINQFDFEFISITFYRSSLPPLSSPQLSLLDPPPMAPPPHMLRRSSPLSHTLMSTESLMTTARPTSRRQRHKIPTVLLLVASWLLFLTAESRPPPTPLTTSTDSSLMSHTREPQSTHQSQRRDTDTPQPMLPQPQLTSQLVLKLLGGS